MRPILCALVLSLTWPVAAAGQAPRGGPCGEMITLPASDGASLGLSLSRPRTSPAVTLVLLPGGGGNVDLDPRGCPRALRGNSLIRSIPEFNALGFATALVDAPSSHKGEDGLGGHRVTPAHARELGFVVATLRARIGGTVWVVGTSRGSISAANLAARERDAGAPDGVVITAIVSVGDPRALKPWVAQSVFDLPLGAITAPVLLVGHEADACRRSPASQMERVAARLTAARHQVVVVRGGPGGAGLTPNEACEGRSPHGFLDQEREVAAGIARFVQDGRY